MFYTMYVLEIHACDCNYWQYIDTGLKCADNGVNQERDTTAFNKIDSNEKDEYCNVGNEDSHDF